MMALLDYDLINLLPTSPANHRTKGVGYQSGVNRKCRLSPTLTRLPSFQLLLGFLRFRLSAIRARGYSCRTNNSESRKPHRPDRTDRQDAHAMLLEYVGLMVHIFSDRYE